MAKKISPEITQHAQALREGGATYLEIANELDIGLTWCKTNLSKIKVIPKENINALESKSKTPKGLSKGEIAKSLDINQPKEQLKKDVQKMTRRIRKRSDENVVRPNWMVPEFARYITDRVVEEGMAAEQRIHEQAVELRTMLLQSCESEDEQKDIPSVFALKSAIATLAYTMMNQSSAAGSILSGWLDSLYNTANKLETRNSTKEVSVKVVPFTPPQWLQDFDDIAY